MSSEARRQAGEIFDGGGKEAVRGVLITLDGVLWRSGAMSPTAFPLGEDLGFLARHQMFTCLSGNCGLQEIMPESASEE